MGISSSIIEEIIKTAQERLNDILEYYNSKGKIKKENKYYMKHSIIILLTMREIDNILELMNNTKESCKIPQYNFNLKKTYTIKFSKNENISNFKNKIIEIKYKLNELIEIEQVKNDYATSLIDNITNPNEGNNFLMKIIENAYDSNFHKFFIDNYIHEFIKYKLDAKNINTKEVLSELKMAKYIIQILIFINLFIKYSYTKKEPIEEGERKECFENILKGNIIMINFLILECEKKYPKEIKAHLKNDNIKVIDELSLLYQKLLNIIEQIESKIKI